MTPFTTLTGIAAPLPLRNVDTDMIIPKQFLKTIRRAGLGKNLFDDLRQAPDFVLNTAPWDRAVFLVAGANFGCGSSREHAPWALLDFGIRCIIAPSFADIFYNNCFKNGMLPLILPQEQVDVLMKEADACRPLTVSLPDLTVTTTDGQAFPFTLDPFRHRCLMEGLDDIGLTLEHASAITAFETARQTHQPWA